MRINTKNTGNIGEDLSCRIIIQKGYKVLFRNFRTKFGEIDVVCLDKEELVFIEVKTLINKNVYQITPEDNLTKSKLEKMKRISLWFANQHPELINPAKGWRIDLLALSLEDGICRYKHYKNIH